MSAHEALGLGRALRARSLPLASALVVVVALSAPTAWYVVHADQLRVRAAAVAGQVALGLRHAAQQQPLLFRYDTAKLVRAFEWLRADSTLGTILVLDASQRRLAGLASAEAGGASLWHREDVVLDGEVIATVWVAAPLSAARAQALSLLLPFGLLGLLLGGLLYVWPMRSIERAEARIRQLWEELLASREAIAAANVDLEAEVDARVHELRGAHVELQRADAELRALAARASGLQATERRAIARDLHDGAGQVLTAIRLDLQVLRSHAPQLQARSDRLLSLVDDAIEEIRRAVDSLGPSIVDDVGLPGAVRAHCRDVAEGSGIEVACDVSEVGNADAVAVAYAAYRIVQEALHNVVKHAQASRVVVQVRPREGVVVVEVRDDGVGIDAKGRARRGHGIDGMRARAELLGGAFEVGVADGGGTRVHAELPVPQGESGREERGQSALPGP